jgi:hypothetical protein
MKKTKQKTNKLICILLSGFFTFYGIPTDLNAQTTPSDELTAQKPSAQNNILTLDEMNAKTSEMIKKLKNSKKDSSFFELGSEDGALSRSESRIARKKSIDKFTERKNDVDPSTLEDARFMALEDAVDVEGAAFGAMIKSSSINAESLRKFSEKSAEVC